MMVIVGEINIDDCINNPCLNNGSCVDGVNSYTCVCSPGYTDCDQDPCMNNATSPGLYSNSCLDGFTGSHCEADINE